MYNIVMTNPAIKDARKLEQAGLKPKAAALLRVIRQNPFQPPRPMKNCRAIPTPPGP
jgi:hypothetical protein